MRTISLLLFLLLCQSAIGFSQTVIQMKKEGGVSVIPCKVNGLKLSFVFDTGAADVSISMTEALFMLKNDYLSKDDILGTNKYGDATGTISEGIVINLKEIDIAGIKLQNVAATIIKNTNAPLLLGQSAISKLGNVQLDLAANTITITSKKNTDAASGKVEHFDTYGQEEKEEATLTTSQTSPPRLSKYFIDRSGHALYLPAKPNKVEISYSPDSSKVYTINCIDTTHKANFYFGAIVVDLKESIVGNEENILEKYLDYLKSNFKIKESAGYGKGHTLDSHPAAKGMIDYWRDEEGNEWKITGWADANTIVVMYEYGAKEYPIFNIVDLFMKGFRFKGDT